MEKKVDIVALGELLIDFTEAGQSPSGMRLFEQNPGGAPANLLTVASHMGYQTAFVGKIGDDMHGAFLRETLEKENIDTHALVSDPDVFTTLAFVAIDEKSGERQFSFARKPGADTQLKPEELDEALLSDCKIFHFGSLSLTDDPAKEATLQAVRLAKEAGALISYDPNYRASLWKDPDSAVNAMKSVIPLVDIMKVSDEESLLLTGEKDYEAAVKRLLSMGPKMVAVTLGKDGVLLSDGTQTEIIPGFQVDAIDTTGAGDSFWGGFLSGFLELKKDFADVSWEEKKKCARQGNAVAALCVQKRGGIPAIPARAEVLKFLVS